MQPGTEKLQYIQKLIRNIPDFPKPGIQFKDITPLLGDRKGLKFTSELLMSPFSNEKIDVVVGMESRGFLFGPVLASLLDAGFVPVRKPNKLPSTTIKADYELEYGYDSVEMHIDAIKKGDRVIIHDDLIATGGTASAATELVQRLGGQVVGYSFIIELAFLTGRAKLESSAPVHTLITIE